MWLLRQKVRAVFRGITGEKLGVIAWILYIDSPFYGGPLCPKGAKTLFLWVYPWGSSDAKGSYKYYAVSGLDSDQGNYVTMDGTAVQATDVELAGALKKHGEARGLANREPNFNMMRMRK